ncbi:hypothetical protein CLV81_2295 [Flagellimonas meridianipacifica]|uniref:Uncharacterized protein n=1 Tax=Flagellimonas meridianipacifica TaxID=1080225 RepID=A0A2T0M8S9_9FLAO|nr:hypothetical protein CLV81_2295 [Allomuricauda pacifica]
MLRLGTEATVQVEVQELHQDMVQTQEPIVLMDHRQTQIVEPIEVVALQEALHAIIPQEEAHEAIKAGPHQEVEPIVAPVVAQEAVEHIEALAAEVLGVQVASEALEAGVQEAQVALEVLEEDVPQLEDHLEAEVEEEDKFPKTLSTKKIIQNEEIINFHRGTVMRFCKCPEH